MHPLIKTVKSCSQDIVVISCSPKPGSIKSKFILVHKSAVYNLHIDCRIEVYTSQKDIRMKESMYQFSMRRVTKYPSPVLKVSELVLLLSRKLFLVRLQKCLDDLLV
jgi:hypothetical protein